jgi:hypothetical protein
MFLQTESGSKIPVNVLPSVAGNLEIVGDVARVVPFKERAGRTLYVAHFVNCPAADQWRRPR